MPDIGLSSSFSPVVLILSFLVAAAFAVLAYRRTTPPVSRGWRVALGSLRFLVLFILFFLLSDPVAAIFRSTSVPPSVVILLDNSQSMTLTSNGDPRGAVSRFAASPELSLLSDRGTLRWATFDNSVRRLAGGWSEDALRFDGDRTDLTGAFESLRSEPIDDNIASYVLLSDGNPTSASNPSYAADALGVPVFTVGVGDTTVRKDILISDVLHNSVAYAGTRVPVQVTVRSNGYNGERVEVILSVRGSAADRSTITVGSGTGDYRTTLFMTPESVGTVRATVSISRLPDEVTYENNRSVFFTTVLSGKRTVLLLAGTPGQDVAFVRRALEADSNVAVMARIERPDGSFLDGGLSDADIRKSDAIFLVGFPGPYTTDATLRLLSSQIALNKPVFFMMSRTLDRGKLTRILPLLPVSVETLLPTELRVFMAVPNDLRQHPLLRLGPETAWSALPPLFQPQGVYGVRPEAQVIGTVRMQSRTLRDPLLVVRSVAGNRSIALLGYGIWRWKMLSPQGGYPDNPLDMFVSNTVQWLTAIEDQRRFRVTPSKESFSALEPTLFRAEVYDESMRPVNDATVEMGISGEGRSYSVLFSSIDNGQYEGSGTCFHRASIRMRRQPVWAHSGWARRRVRSPSGACKPSFWRPG